MGYLTKRNILTKIGDLQSNLNEYIHLINRNENYEKFILVIGELFGDAAIRYNTTQTIAYDGKIKTEVHDFKDITTMHLAVTDPYRVEDSNYWYFYVSEPIGIEGYRVLQNHRFLVAHDTETRTYEGYMRIDNSKKPVKKSYVADDDDDDLPY